MSGNGDTASPRERRGERRVGLTSVLVVDDSTSVRRIVRRALEQAGHRVTEAADGRECLEVCRSELPDLVLLDVDMPRMDGMATLRAMKDDEMLSAVPVLFLTAMVGGDDAARGLDLGAQDYLRKPCDPAELLARVASALRVSARDKALHLRGTELSEMSNTDLLTGLGNRRHLEGRIADLIALLGPDARMGVVLLDVDHFKDINDSEGHPTGDVVLQILVARLSTAPGRAASLVRWGGDEFLVLAPALTGVHLEELGQALRSAVVRSPFAVGDGRVLDVTVSVGCATGRLDGVLAAVLAADGALYKAKRAGRNCVRLFVEPLTVVVEDAPPPADVRPIAPIAPIAGTLL